MSITHTYTLWKIHHMYQLIRDEPSHPWIYDDYVTTFPAHRLCWANHRQHVITLCWHNYDSWCCSAGMHDCTYKLMCPGTQLTLPHEDETACQHTSGHMSKRRHHYYYIPLFVMVQFLSSQQLTQGKMLVASSRVLFGDILNFRGGIYQFCMPNLMYDLNHSNLETGT